MRDPDTQLQGRASDLRRAFDRSFAEAPHVADPPTEDLLAIRLGAAGYALRLSEIAALFTDVRVSAIPSNVHELVGVASLRGVILPVYDLASLLGQPTSTAGRFLILAAKMPVAFAFHELDGHLRVGRDAIAADTEAAAEHAREMLRLPQARPIVRLASVLEALDRRARQVHATKEH